jgi:hypothetical protein
MKQMKIEYCHVHEWLSKGFWIGFIYHLQVVTTNNYDTITNLHTLVFSVSYKHHLSFPGNGS